MPSVVLGLLVGVMATLAVALGTGIVLALTRLRGPMILILLGFAAGTLLGTAFMDLLPEAVEARPPGTVGGLALAAVIGFFVLENRVFWRHCHHAACEIHNVAGYLILIGDSVHNVVDGLVLGAAFVADPWLGATVGLAILAHEVPQEVGDFVLLLESGLTKTHALAYNLASAAAIFPGILAGNVLAEAVEPTIGVTLALTTGGFLYVALADLVPDLHRRAGAGALKYQLVPMLVGIALIGLIGWLET